MQAKEELLRLKERLHKQMLVLESEMGVVDRAIQLLERDAKTGSTATAPRDNRFARLGLADTCRQIVADEWIAPSQVRDSMLSGGYKVQDSSKLLGYVFATLKRLAKKGDLEAKRVDGKLKYRKRQSTASASDVVAA